MFFQILFEYNTSSFFVWNLSNDFIFIFKMFFKIQEKNTF